MSTWPLVKFVDAPSPTANVRFDCNDLDAPAPRRAVEFDPGVPTLEGDPDAIGQQWGFRSPSLTVRVKGSKANAVAALQGLAKEQLRRTNWVMFQLSAETAPMFYKTYKTGYQPLSLDRVDVDKDTGWSGPTPDAWETTVPLIADAFAYGVRQVLSAIQFEQTIPTDLDGGWNALTAALPTLKGDAPTSLRVSLSTGSNLVGGEEWMVGCISGASSMTDPAFDIGTGDGFTAGTGTSGGSSNAAYVGGTFRTVTIAPNDGGAGTSLAARLTGTGVSATLPQGRYKVLLRYEADTTGAGKTFLFRWNTQGADLENIVSVALGSGLTTTWQGWVDLGDLSFPRNVADLPADSGVSMPTTINFVIYIGTADNSAGTVRIDALKFIPVTGPAIVRSTIAKTKFVAAVNLFQTPVWDGDSESIWVTNGTTVNPGTPTQTSGSFLIADPAAEKNLLVAVAMKSQGASAGVTGVHTSRKARATATVSYFPRYLLGVGDGT